MEDLTALINSNPDPRILKRALAVKMSLQRYSLAQIAELLQTSRQFVSKWKSIYLNEGAIGLGLGYTGTKPYLTPEQETQVSTWLQQKSEWSLNELECYLLEEFDVEYASKQSYYNLFHEAGITFKKAQRSNPKKDPEQVNLKKKS
jgi:putative transposase